MKYCVYLLRLVLITGAVGWSMTTRGATTMADAHDPNPLCVGRLITSLPTDAKPAVTATFQYIDVNPPKTIDGFNSEVKLLGTRADGYKENRYTVTDYDRTFAKAADWNPDTIYGNTQLAGFDVYVDRQVIVLGYHTELGAPSINVDLYKIVNKIEYVFSQSGVVGDEYEKANSSLRGAAGRFMALQRGEVPATPGFCVAGGMFADAGKPPLHESFTLVVSSKSHPDARFVIDGHAIAKVDTDEPSLKRRVDSELGILRSNVEGHVAVLVRGEREAAGQKGFQIGLSVPNDTVEGTTAYKFFWAADGIPDDASRPAMEVSLTIQPDDDKPASFADARQAETLWNELLQGLRIRPGSVAR